jgi:uncharacterized protein YjlB
MRQPETYSFDDSGGGIPNSRLPVLVYRDVDGAHGATECVRLFARNGWLGAWVNRIHPFQRLHSTAHEVLGIVDGSGAVMFGDPGGRRVEVARGDVLVVPAGTGHGNAGPSSELLVVGAYPNGMEWDMRRGLPAERDEVLANIAAVPLPHSDPVHGPEGPLTKIWRGRDVPTNSNSAVKA